MWSGARSRALRLAGIYTLVYWSYEPRGFMSSGLLSRTRGTELQNDGFVTVAIDWAIQRSCCIDDDASLLFLVSFNGLGEKKIFTWSSPSNSFDFFQLMRRAWCGPCQVLEAVQEGGAHHPGLVCHPVWGSNGRPLARSSFFHLFLSSGISLW